MQVDNYTDEEIVNVLNFISFVQFECEQHGIVCDLRDTTFVKTGNIRCAGWFSEGGLLDHPKLVTAMNRPDALEILTHEYCHLTQYVEGLPLWSSAGASIEELDKWLSGEYVEDIDHHIQNAIQLELDNEKRTVKCIKQWNLPIDTVVYTRKANAYLQFYLWLRHSRKWSSPNNSPYRNPRIVAAMKDTFRMDYTKLTPKLLALFEQEKI
jgi:hypothetical protein